ARRAGGALLATVALETLLAVVTLLTLEALLATVALFALLAIGAALALGARFAVGSGLAFGAGLAVEALLAALTLITLEALRAGGTGRTDVAAVALRTLRAVEIRVGDEVSDDVDHEIGAARLRGHGEHLVLEHDARFVHRL